MNYDLNIKNYKKNELTEMFDLPPNYGREIVDIKEAKLRESILKNKEIKNEVRMKTIYFLTEAKKILLGDVYQKVEQSNDKCISLNFAGFIFCAASKYFTASGILFKPK